VLPVGDPLDVEAPAVMVERPQRPDALFGYDSTATVREVLAYLLGGLALASVALGLAAGARSARREVAVLKTIGFTSTQVRRVLHLHGLIVGAVALLVGVPLGLAGGRAAWQLFADHLGVATDPVTPTLRVVAVAVILVLLCLLLTLPQARSASRRAPAQILRAE
jgi:ABC-type lipoprotein release transport system permease subunit